MKKASRFEIIAARCWNILNEGKPFFPVFITGAFLLFNLGEWTASGFWANFGTSLLLNLPLIIVYIYYDFPLKLRWFLWIPLVSFYLLFGLPDPNLVAFSSGSYFFFTVILWGTIYYHLRIGAPLTNFTRFWKLVLKNSDPTSGNFQEQMPKTLLGISSLDLVYGLLNGGEPVPVVKLGLFFLGIWVMAFIVHYWLFNWRPAEYPAYTSDPRPERPLAQKVIMIIIDGCRKDRLADADTPFIDRLRQQGTEYTLMETIYPARTVTCFSSLYTGTYPREHGIRSNFVWRLGIRCESIFDKLAQKGKKGVLLGIAHLIDAFGHDHVESVTAVMHNDVADANIMQRAKLIMEEQNPDLLVIQLISVDQTGHSRGSLYPEYRQKIAEADRHIEDFYNWLAGRGLVENTTFIIAADHGQSDGIGGHGHLDEGERYVPFIMTGKAIKPGKTVDDLRSIVSVAPTISYLLGVDYPDKSRGPVLTEALEDNRQESRPEFRQE